MGRGEIAHPTCLTMLTATAGSQCISEMGMESFAPSKEQILAVQHGVLSPMHPCITWPLRILILKIYFIQIKTELWNKI